MQFGCNNQIYWILFIFIFKDGWAQVAGNIPITISETAPAGTIVYNNTGSGNCSIKSTSPPNATSYFRFDYNELVIDRPLDLEVIYSWFKDDIAITVHCEQTLVIDIAITPKNEFPPVFQGAPFHVKISEFIKRGQSIFSLRGKVLDTDRVKYGEIKNFTLNPYLIAQIDGRSHFSVDKTTGVVTTSSGFDYDTMGIIKYFVLNVTVTDDGDLESSPATINITVGDEDDMPPQFTRPQYHVVINVAYQGELRDKLVAPIHAQDGDTGVRANVTYSIVGDSELVSSNLEINATSGVVSVIQPFSNITTVPEGHPLTLDVIITATEYTQNKFETNATLVMLVYLHLPTTTLPTTTLATRIVTVLATRIVTVLATRIVTVETSQTPSKNDNSYLIYIETIIPGVLVLTIIAIVVIVLVRRKRKIEEKKRYSVIEREKRKRAGELDGVNTLSSISINPYELVNAYAHIEMSKHDSEAGSESARDNESARNIGESDLTQEATDVSDAENARHADDQHFRDESNDVFNVTENEGDDDDVNDQGDMYAKVDKRKSRKRANVYEVQDVQENEMGAYDNSDFAEY